FLNVLLGGVGPSQVFQATVVLATTAGAGGFLGGLIALWGDKKFAALALTDLFLVLYFCLGRALCLFGDDVASGSPSRVGHACGSLAACAGAAGDGAGHSVG